VGRLRKAHRPSAQLCPPQNVHNITAHEVILLNSMRQFSWQRDMNSSLHTAGARPSERKIHFQRVGIVCHTYMPATRVTKVTVFSCSPGQK
jgi:hypothetical protein